MYNIMCPADHMHHFFCPKSVSQLTVLLPGLPLAKPSMCVTKQNKNFKRKNSNHDQKENPNQLRVKLNNTLRHSHLPAVPATAFYITINTIRMS